MSVGFIEISLVLPYSPPRWHSQTGNGSLSPLSSVEGWMDNSCSLSGALESWEVARGGPELSSGPYLSPAAITVSHTDSQEQPVVRGDTQDALWPQLFVSLGMLFEMFRRHTQGSPSLTTPNCPYSEVTCQLPPQKGWHQAVCSGISLHRLFSDKKKK